MRSRQKTEVLTEDLEVVLAVAELTEAAGSDESEEKRAAASRELGEWLRGKHGHVEQAGMTWVENGGAALGVGQLGSELSESSLAAVVALLAAALRLPSPAAALIRAGLVPALLPLLIELPYPLLAAPLARLLALASSSPLAQQDLLLHGALAVLLSHPSLHPWLAHNILLHLIKCSTALRDQFIELGGPAQLVAVLQSAHTTPQEIASCVAVLALVCQCQAGQKALAAEEMFALSATEVMTRETVDDRTRLHLGRSLLRVAETAEGLWQLQPEAVLPLVVFLERETDGEVESQIQVVALELLTLCCNSVEGLEQVDALGGEELVLFILSLLRENRALCTAGCGLMHVLALGVHRELVVEGLKDLMESVPEVETFRLTLELMGESKVSQPANRESALLSSSSEAVRQARRLQRKRALLIRDFHQTERQYSLALFTVVKTYFPALQPLMTATESSAIFSNMTDLYALHKDFLKKLDKAMRADSGDDATDICIASLLLELVDRLVPHYGEFLKWDRTGIEMLQDKLRLDREFRQAVWKESKKLKHSQMSFEHHLELPRLRLSRYKQLVGSLLELTPAEHTDYDNLVQANTRLADFCSSLLPSSTFSSGILSSETSEIGGGDAGTGDPSLGRSIGLDRSGSNVFLPKTLRSKLAGMSDSSDLIKLPKHRLTVMQQEPPAPASTPEATPEVSRRKASPPASPRKWVTPLSASASVMPTIAARRQGTPSNMVGGGEAPVSPRTMLVSSDVTHNRNTSAATRINGNMSNNTTTPGGVSTASRISLAYGRSEKLKIGTAKEGSQHPYVVRVEATDETVGMGYHENGKFHFVDLAGEEVLRLPLSELAKAKRKK